MACSSRLKLTCLFKSLPIEESVSHQKFLLFSIQIKTPLIKRMIIKGVIRLFSQRQSIIIWARHKYQTRAEHQQSNPRPKVGDIRFLPIQTPKSHPPCIRLKPSSKTVRRQRCRVLFGKIKSKISLTSSGIIRPRKFKMPVKPGQIE